jgi:hypothetical protein
MRSSLNRGGLNRPQKHLKTTTERIKTIGGIVNGQNLRFGHNGQTTERPKTPENDHRQGGTKRRKSKLTESEVWAPQTDNRRTADT